jgi:hypothetical protein
MPLVLRQIGELVFEFLLDAVRFPLWWYSGGLVKVFRFCRDGFRATAWRVSLGLFARYLFTPMYGDYTYSGRALSFVVRLVLLVWKSVRLVFALVGYTVVLLVWCVLLPTILLMLVASL